MSARADNEEERVAASWAMRHPLSADEQVELEAWLARGSRRPGLLLRAQAALSVIDRAVSTDEAAPAPVVPDRRNPPWARRRVLGGLAGAMAATVVGMIGWSRMVHERVVTQRGEIRRLPLGDGSVATINTDSALRVALGAENRRIVLDRGEAWFQVAKDRSRPFVVDAGLASARAVGTAFSVHRGTDGVQVNVTEGTVAVWAAGEQGALTILTAGQFATFDGRTSTPRTGTAPQSIERALAWRNGEISLEDETLGSAMAQFNRYNRRQLVLGDRSLADERLVGLFQIDKPEDFAASLAATHDIDVAVETDRITIRRKMR